MKQISQTLSRILDKKVVFETVSSEEAVNRGFYPGTIYFMEWMDIVPGYGFKIEDTKQYGVELKSFAEWVEENRHRFEIN